MFISFVIQSMGWPPLSQSIKIQTPAKSHFLNVDLVWKDGFRHGGQNKVVIETAYISHACVFEFLQGEWGDMQIVVKWNISKNLSPQDVKKLTIKNHLRHTWYGFKTYKPFPLVIFASSRVSHSCVFWFDWMKTMFCKYERGYGSEDHYENPNHTRFIKHGCLAHFSIKRFYTRPNVVEIIFYHQTHTQSNGDPTHCACDLRSISWMSASTPRMSQKFKFLYGPN